MSLQKINKLKDEKGFTIVELLIVIVVIGILAAITIVAFNGVQNRAKAAQYQADANGISKVAESFNAKETSTGYPTAASDFNSADAKLPNGVTVTFGAAPTTNNLVATGSPDMATTANVKAYRLVSCATASKGFTIYYADPTNAGTGVAAMKTLTVGSCT